MTVTARKHSLIDGLRIGLFTMLMAVLLTGVVSCGGGSGSVLPTLDDTETEETEETVSQNTTVEEVVEAIVTPNQVSLSLNLATIFEFPARATQKGTDIDGEAVSDSSGRNVMSSDGNVLAIAGDLNDGAGTDAGHVRVYEWTGTAWTQRGNDLDGEAAGDQFGSDISLSSTGNVLAVGAKFNDGGGFDSGHVRVFVWNGTAWTQRGADIDGGANFGSGESVALSADGTVVAIGSPTGPTIFEAKGVVRVYEWNGAAWVKVGEDIVGEADDDLMSEEGALDISADGTVIAIGAGENDGAANRAGHTRVFALVDDDWVQRGPDIDGDAATDFSGSAVSLSNDGTVLAVGAYFNDEFRTNAGQVKIFAWSGTAWVQRGSDIFGEKAGDRSGRSLDLSGDGTSIVIGGALNDGNGSSSGHIRVYDFDSTDWVLRTSDIDGEAAGDSSGAFVSMSDDGATFASGAPGNDGTGTSAGHVRVFETSALSILSTITATLDEVSTANVVVTLAATGSATGEGTDYTISSTNITILQGQTTGTATVTAVSDQTVDDGETVILDITDVSGAVASGNTQVTITIDDV